MKEILISIMFLFAVVVCYAAPPPGEQPVVFAPDVGCQYTADAVVTVAPVMVEAQEVAYVYQGNYQLTEAPQFAEVIVKADVPPMPVITINYSTCSLSDDLPPLMRTWHVVTYNYIRDLQFTNYGYPLSMN